MNGTGLDFARILERKAPAYLDLLTAETEVEFEKAFDDALDVAVRRLEQSSNDYETLDENALNRTLAGFLSCPGLAVTAETHSNGHVDLTITAEHSSPLWTKLAEAKIYDGPVYHVEGLVQLLTRYVTGRGTRGLLVTYVKKRDIEGKIKSVRVAVDKELPEDQKEATKDHRLQWSFLSRHGHSCGKDVDVMHIGINMHPPKKP